MGDFDNTLAEIREKIDRYGSCLLTKDFLEKLVTGNINTDAKLDEKAAELVAAHEWLTDYDVHYLYESVTFIGPALPPPE